MLNPFILVLLLAVVSCRTLGSLGSGFHVPTTQYNGDHNRALHLEYLQEKKLEEVSGCKLIGSYKGEGSGGIAGQNQAKEMVKQKAVESKADTVVYEPLESVNVFSNNSVSGHYYRCNEKEADWEKIKEKKYQSHANNDMSLFFGNYLSRDGILKKLGKMGPTFGAQLDIFKPFIDRNRNSASRNSHGFFILWTFDHFRKTNSELLYADFKDQNYTNYMFGGGYAFRRILTNKIQFHYRGGLAFNFIEIDTFRQNGDYDDSKYTDITVSTIHKLGVDFLVKKADSKNIYKQSQIRIGPSLFYYFAPDPIGEFKIEEGSKGLTPGGSLAWQLDVKWEFY